MSNLQIKMPTVDRLLENCHTKRYTNSSRIIHISDSPTTLYYITGGSISVMIEDHIDHEIVLASQMTRRLRATSRKVINLSFLDVAGRIARTLLDLVHQPDAMTHPNVYTNLHYTPRNCQNSWLFAY